MCDNPIHILNKTRRFIQGVSSPVLDVPCGHCRSCENRKQDDWFVRASAEFKRCIDKGGFVFFPTLTYNNDSLPVWYDTEFDYKVNVFEKDHFKAFRNKLRVYLKRAGYDLTGDNTMRYFYVCEFGTEKGRSHLHCLLFVPLDIPRSLFKSLVKKSWIYGFVRYSPAGDCVNSVKGVKYVMKYLSKDCSWYDKYKVQEYIDRLRSLSHDNDINVALTYKNRYNEFRRHLPHHCQSMGFGSSFELEDDMFVRDEIPSNKVYLFDEKFVYHVPIYYKRKFLYNYDKVNKLFTLNERGLKVLQYRFPYLVKSLERYYDSALSLDRYNLMIDYLYTQIGEDALTIPYYEDFKRMCHEFTSNDIANFCLSFRYRSLFDAEFYSLNCCSVSEISTFMSENAYYYYVASVNVGGVLPYPFGSAPKHKLYRGFNDLSILSTLHLGLCHFELVLKKFNSFVQRAYIKQQDEFKKQKCRDYYLLNVI